MYRNICDNETIEQRSTLALVRASTSLICFVLGLLLLGLVCARRLFKTTLQRQYVYLLVCTQVYLLVLGVGADGIFDDYGLHQEPCVAIGFLTQWASVTELFFTFSIIVVLHVAILRNHAHGVLRGRLCGVRSRLALEAAFVALSVASPPVLDWMPFSKRSYGLAGAWCWITSLDDRANCTDTGFLYQLGLQYVPIVFTSATCVALAVTINVVLCSAACRHRELSHHYAKRARETALLVLCIILSFSLVVPELVTRTIIHRLDSAASVPYPVYVLYAAGTPLGRLVLSFDLLLYLYSFHTVLGVRGVAFRRCRARCLAKCCCCCKKKYNLLDVEDDDDGDNFSSAMPVY